jgi:hypothetical protein
MLGGKMLEHAVLDLIQSVMVVVEDLLREPRMGFEILDELWLRIALPDYAKPNARSATAGL